MKLGKVKTEFRGMDTIPLINMVFLILLLVIVTLNFENTKAEERMKLPTDMLARPPAVRPEHELILNFGYERNADGARVKPIPEVFYNERYVQVRDIAPDLKMERNVIERVYGPEIVKEVTVLIRAESEVPAGLIQELIKKCQEAGFSKFSLRGNEEGPLR